MSLFVDHFCLKVKAFEGYEFDTMELEYDDNRTNWGIYDPLSSFEFNISF
jgi:hypothetical protein